MKMSNKRIAAGVLALAFVFGGVGVPAANEAGLNFDIAASARDTIEGERHGSDTDIQHFRVDTDTAVRIVDDNDIGGGIITTKRVIVDSGTCGENLTWTLDNDGTLTVSGTGEMTNYDSYDEIPWYDFLPDVNTVVIKNGVTSIGDSAFSDCNNLTNVTIPDSVTRIGDSAFYYCYNLIDVTIPDSVTSIGDFSFLYCLNLTSISIPDSVTSIGKSAFFDCIGLKSITIPDSVVSIGNNAFGYYRQRRGCLIFSGKIDDFKIYCNKGTAAEKYAKDNGFICIVAHGTCGENLTWELDNEGTLTISGTGKMTDYNFYDPNLPKYGPWECDLVKNVIIQDGVTSIGRAAFFGCSNLTSVTIPNSVTSIGDAAFYECSNLTSVTIPCSVTNIGAYSFESCKKLTGINIPDGVTSIEFSAFSNCTNLTSITIPNSVTSIKGGAFSGCTNLTSVTIPDNVTRIEYSAFANCSKLTSVTIPNSVTSIESDAFSNCNNLTICCYKGSAAEKYAKDNNIAYELIAPPVVTYTFGNGCANLKWTPVPDAEKYAIALYTNGKWMKFAETKSTSYILNLKPGKYKITVIAMINGEWIYDLSNAVTIIIPSVSPRCPVVTYKLSESGGQFKLNWTAVEGAEKYGLAVYQSGKWLVKAQFAGNVTTYTSPKMNRGTYKMVVCAKLSGEWDISDINNRAITVTIA